MRSVNANLLEINQAKSRINQAKKEGKTPDPKDLELVKTEKQNAFAISQYTDIMTIEKFAKHITSHGSVYSRADISAILYIAVDCMREMLLEGKKIRLGDLGDFSLLLTSKGAEDADKFTAQNITGVKVQWEPGQEFKNLRDDAEFNLVASRSAQAPLSRRLRRVRPTLISTPQPLRIIRQAVLPQVVQTPVRPAATAKALNQAAVLPARTILATALNSPRIDWLGC